MNNLQSLQSVDSLRFELDKKDREIKYLNDTYLISIDGWNYELEKKNQIIAKLNREIFEKDREISELKRKLDTDRLITDTI